MDTSNPRPARSLRRRLSVCVAGLLALGLSALKLSEKTSETPPITYFLYNYSGKPIVAATVADTTGGQAAFEGRIGDQSLDVRRAGHRIGRDASVTVEWVIGEGRAKWYQATTPIKIEQLGGTNLEIYLRPDGFVCASLLDERHGTNSRETTLERVKMARAARSCAKPRELAHLAPEMAPGFRQDTISHSWDNYDGPGKSTLTFNNLVHATGPVAFRYGNAFKGGPWYLNEFYSVRMIGKKAAWLVKAALKPADPGMFVVTGDDAGWQSRFLGRVGDEERRLSETRVLIGTQMVVDTATADIYMLPEFHDISYWVLGQSKDGKSVAVFWQRQSSVRKDGAGTEFSLAMLNLEEGRAIDGKVASVPELPPNENIGEFYRNWYAIHCLWTPLLECR